MQNLLTGLLDLILPPQSKEHAARSLTLEELSVSPKTEDLCDTSIITLLSFDDESAKNLIHALKFSHSNHASRLTSYILHEFLLEEIANLSLWENNRIILAPIPLGKERLKERGYNQVERFLKDAAHSLDIEYMSDALVRIKETLPQTKLSRAERLKNMEGAFAVNPKRQEDLKSAHIILVDDVATTGATLSSAAKTLTKGGTSVTVLAIARA